MLLLCFYAFVMHFYLCVIYVLFQCYFNRKISNKNSSSSSKKSKNSLMLLMLSPPQTCKDSLSSLCLYNFLSTTTTTTTENYRTTLVQETGDVARAEQEER